MARGRDLIKNKYTGGPLHFICVTSYVTTLRGTSSDDDNYRIMIKKLGNKKERERKKRSNEKTTWNTHGPITRAC